MNKKQLSDEMLAALEMIRAANQRAHQAVTEYLDETGETISRYNQQDVKGLEDLVNSCATTANIQDRLEGNKAIVGTKDYKGSLTKKIRKALGYTY